MFLIICGIVIVVVWSYILFVREWLVAKWPDTFKWWHEQVEDRLWARSRAILVARLYWVGGIVIGIHELVAASGYDVTPLLHEIAKFIPEKYQPLALAAFLGVTGIAFEWLRRKTKTAPWRPDDVQ